MGFQFKDNAIHLDIAGNVFNINYTEELLINIKNFYEKAAAQAEEIRDSKDYNKTLDKSINLLKETIDNICGEGAANKIFKDREVNLYDLIDVINYIYTEVGNFQKEKKNKYSTSRAQRRNMRNEHANRSTSNKRKSR